MKKLLPVFFFFIIIGCEQQFEPPQYAKKIVVDGWIEPNQPAKVILTFSTGFFEDIDSASIRNLILTSAKVTVTCDNYSEILMLSTDQSVFPSYIYISNQIRGTEGKSYHLLVEYAGKKLNAVTSIPYSINLDSIWFTHIPNNDTLVSLWISFSDNATAKNYYRISTLRLHHDKQWVPAYIPNFSDQLFNGEYTRIPVYKGNENPLFHQDMIYFTIFDTIRIKFCTVDSITFRFWQSVQEEITKNNNPFASTSMQIVSNIEGGLGIWAGYGTKIYQVNYYQIKK